MGDAHLGAKRGTPKGRLIAVAASGIALLLALMVAFSLFVNDVARAPPNGAPANGGPAGSGQADVGGPFQLVDQDGRNVDEALLKGRWSAVFFGFTYCPDVCPATLQTLQAAAERLGPRAEDLQVLFISVDPERDTPEALKSYLSGFAFPGGVRGLTGTPEQVQAAAKAWRAYYRKNGEGPDYLMDHFSGVYLMNPQGRFDRVFTSSLKPDEIARQIRDAMRA